MRLTELKAQFSAAPSAALTPHSEANLLEARALLGVMFLEMPLQLLREFCA